MIKYFILISICFILSGCLSPKTSFEQPKITNVPATTDIPEWAIPDISKHDLESVKKDLQNSISSSNATQNQQAGLVNASISKLAEKVVGLETTLQLNTDLKAEFKSSATATANAVASINSNINANAELRADIKNEMKAMATAIADLKVDIGKINTELNGVAGIGNKLDTVKNDIISGRDVNYLPKEVVQIIDSNNKMWMYICGTVCGALVTIITCIAGKIAYNSYTREQKMLEIISELPEEHQRTIKRALKDKSV